MVGRDMQRVVETFSKHSNEHHWTWLTRADCDLRDSLETIRVFTAVNPDTVVHLASRVGGLYSNASDNFGFAMDNTRIHLNVVDAVGVCTNTKCLVNVLSTCIFPDSCMYPLTSDQIDKGPPHLSNAGYAHSKRTLRILSGLLHQRKPGLRVINITPTNLYGIHDNFDLVSGHVLPALITKVQKAIDAGIKRIEILGDGKDLRQFVFAEDLARILIWFVFNFEGLAFGMHDCIVSPDQEDEVCISRLCEIVLEAFSQTNLDEWTINTVSSNVTGQFRKTCTSRELEAYIPGFRFTSLIDGIRVVVKSKQQPQ